MSPLLTPDTASARLADRLASVRRGRFVGRAAEIELFRSALLSTETPFSVIHVSGTGGVGKTTLLREFARLAAECGRPVIHLDGRYVDPSPVGFLRALGWTGAPADSDPDAAVPAWPPAGVWLIDTYDAIAPLDDWLRETFLPQLPAQSLVVLAGRNPPATPWRTDLDWAILTRGVELRNLRPEESQTYLATRGIPNEQHAGVLTFTHGHPLALALVADVLSRGDRLAAFDPRDEPNVVRVLLDRLVRDVPSAEHRRALEICVMARATTETLLAEVLEVSDARDLFEWLRSLSFIEQGAHGLYPHDLAREAMELDLRWRSPEGSRRLSQKLSAAVHARLGRAGGLDQQRIWFDVLYLYRHNPVYRATFSWEAIGTTYAEPARPEDAGTILSMVRRHEGDAAARIAQYWLDRQPGAFLVFRDVGNGDVIGFMEQLAIQEATAEDLAADPAVVAAWRFIERHGAIRPGELVTHFRSFMHRDVYQDPSPAINLAAINASIHWMTTPKLAWNVITVADAGQYEPIFSSIHMWRSPEADFDVGGRRYACFTHDWRVEPAAAWWDVKTELVFLTDRQPVAPITPAMPPLLVLSESEFALAVRQALRDYACPSRLAANPLVRSRLVGERDADKPAVATLQSVLRRAVATLTANPKDAKLHRALWHTYLEPAPTQEQAAELLGLPFNTYRYHLARGIERVTDWLWQRELNGSGH